MPVVLREKQERFCQEYLIDLNATQAAVRAGYSPKTASEQGTRLLGKANVSARVQELQSARSVRTEITQDRVLQELWGIATADTNEIVELRRTCCRYCYGEEFRYQFTVPEMERRRKEYFKLLSEMKPGAIRPSFSEEGGVGFDPHKAPKPECTNCFGDGVAAAFVHDTRNLSPGARALYGGVKEGKNGGIEVKLHDKISALEKLGKHLGMFADQQASAGAGTVNIQLVVMPAGTQAKISAGGDDGE